MTGQDRPRPEVGPDLLDHSDSSIFSKSPGSQSRASHNAKSVEKRMARPFPRLRIDRLASVIPTWSDNSVNVILRRSSSKSRLILIAFAISDRQRLFLVDANGFAYDTRKYDDRESGKHSTDVKIECRV